VGCVSREKQGRWSLAGTGNRRDPTIAFRTTPARADLLTGHTALEIRELRTGQALVFRTGTRVCYANSVPATMRFTSGLPGEVAAVDTRSSLKFNEF
jgi:hypothetical protein